MFFKTKIKQPLDDNGRKSFTKDYAKFLNNSLYIGKKTGIIYDAGLANLHEKSSSYQLDRRTPTV